jgi:nucleoside-diphosphate-sugar epimerase
VERFILISFPHIEENTAPDSPAMGRLDLQPKSIHARTRLEAEKYLFNACQNRSINPVVLRAGVIYGRDVKLIEAARKLMRYRLLAIWPIPTWIHLLALPDFLASVEIAIERGGLSGIYNLCDDCPVLLQEFLDELAEHWGYRKPWRLPNGCFYLAATVCEWLATILHSRTPLTRDMIRMGMTSVVADTSRMKREIQRELLYPTFRQGLAIV